MLRATRKLPLPTDLEPWTKQGLLCPPLNLLQALPVLPFSGSWPVLWEHTSCCSHAGEHVPCLIIHGLCPQVLVVKPAECLPE